MSVFIPDFQGVDYYPTKLVGFVGWCFLGWGIFWGCKTPPLQMLDDSNNFYKSRLKFNLEYSNKKC